MPQGLSPCYSTLRVTLTPGSYGERIHPVTLLRASSELKRVLTSSPLSLVLAVAGHTQATVNAQQRDLQRYHASGPEACRNVALLLPYG